MSDNMEFVFHPNPAEELRQEQRALEFRTRRLYIPYYGELSVSVSAYDVWEKFSYAPPGYEHETPLCYSVRMMMNGDSEWIIGDPERPLFVQKYHGISWKTNGEISRLGYAFIRWFADINRLTDRERYALHLSAEYQVISRFRTVSGERIQVRAFQDGSGYCFTVLDYEGDDTYNSPVYISAPTREMIAAAFIENDDTAEDDDE